MPYVVSETEENALRYALEDYATMAQATVRSTIRWSELKNSSRISCHRASIVRELIYLRHGVPLNRKTIGGRIAAIDKGKAKCKKHSESQDIVTTGVGQGEAMPRPALNLRDIGETQETYQVKYRIQRLDRDSDSAQATLVSRSPLHLASSMPSELLTVKVFVNRLSDLFVFLITPWAFKPAKTTLTISGSDFEEKGRRITMVTDSKSMHRTTKCEVGPALAACLVSRPPGHTCRAVLKLVLTEGSAFMNSVLATGLDRVAPVGTVQIVLELDGFQGAGMTDSESDDLDSSFVTPFATCTGLPTTTIARSTSEAGPSRKVKGKARRLEKSLSYCSVPGAGDSIPDTPCDVSPSPSPPSAKRRRLSSSFSTPKTGTPLSASITVAEGQCQSQGHSLIPLCEVAPSLPNPCPPLTNILAPVNPPSRHEIPDRALIVADSEFTYREAACSDIGKSLWSLLNDDVALAQLANVANPSIPYVAGTLRETNELGFQRSSAVSVSSSNATASASSAQEATSYPMSPPSSAAESSHTYFPFMPSFHVGYTLQ